MELGLKGKTVAVTGGSSGIGRAVAEAFAAEGCRVAVCGRNKERLEEMKREFQEKGFELFTESADVGKTKDLEHFAESVEKNYGSIDIWINNAGINFRKPFDSVTEEEWHLLVDSNFKSVFYGTAIASKYMKKNSRGGVIINTSSFTSLIPTAGISLYSAVKAAVDNLTRSTAAELACHNIRVVSVIPGYIETALTASNVAANFDALVASIPMKRLGKPEDLVTAYLFLASDAASYINGVSLPVAGGKFATQNPHWSWQQIENEKGK